jgi:hypothetical protein
MCCWVKHDETKGSEHFKRNTDLCFVPDIQSFAAGLFGQLQNFWSGANTVFSLGCLLCLWQQFLEKHKKQNNQVELFLHE